MYTTIYLCMTLIFVLELAVKVVYYQNFFASSNFNFLQNIFFYFKSMLCFSNLLLMVYEIYSLMCANSV